jgi:predicted DNA repair protein MutK
MIQLPNIVRFSYGALLFAIALVLKSTEIFPQFPLLIVGLALFVFYFAFKQYEKEEMQITALNQQKASEKLRAHQSNIELEHAKVRGRAQKEAIGAFSSWFRR